MNSLSNIFSNIKGDVSVNIVFDPGSAIFLLVMIIIAVVLSHVIVKAIG